MKPEQIILGLFLGLCSIEDLHSRKMHTVLLLAGSIAGVLCHLIFRQRSIWEVLGGLAVGVGVLLLSRLTDGRIGDGDGLLLMATGTFLGFVRNLALLWGAVLLVNP